MDLRPLVLKIEKPYSAFLPDTETAEDVLLAGLRWRSDHWTGLAVTWIKQGAPISADIAHELEQVAQDKDLPQKIRQDAFAAAKKWHKAQLKAEHGTPPDSGLRDA
jgi:hypothetical protein